MDKQQRRHLNQWLKQQGKLAKMWLSATIALGVISTLFLIGQAGLLASILHQIIIEHVDKHQLIPSFIGLAAMIVGRAVCTWGKEITGYRCGEYVRIYIRQQILDKLRDLGPAYIKGKPAGTWATLLLEQVEEMQDFFSRYLPQMSLAVFIPFIILVVVFPSNWAAGLIFLITAPLVPLFMALAGMKAADANKKNFKALQRLSGHFYDRLQSMTTIRLFHRAQAETELLRGASDVLRKSTMDVLRIAFLSSAVLEFFTSISIAITAVYFGFSYIGELNFGYYGASITLFTGLFVLVLAPEFYQPLRDLGTYYHAKAQALGAAESLVEFLEADVEAAQSGSTVLPSPKSIIISATDLVVFSSEKTQLLGPVSFVIDANQTTALVGPSGAGKTSLINAILGFLPYTGSLTINGIEVKELNLKDWRKNISWVGQNPLLINGSIYENITLGQHDISEEQLSKVLKDAFADEFVYKHGLDYHISDRSGGLSVGQAQRLALARAMLQQGSFWLLDEPTASLDAHSENLVMRALDNNTKNTTTLMVTHQLEHLKQVANILVMQSGKIVQSGHYDEIKHSGLFAQMLSSKQQIDSENKGNLDA
ncbi:cysteine/glutathione ABC transporter permease/ATP-binding protein CydD [Vibrio sp. S17_S38]|uniref:heme ABC transporter permease/ATP-binding protein CydD n=1 Tax=Vibrio sp. S17_S38 TaxID=2720229 RepID=UPI0016807797|nr:cysteine/glutathione ABC transporter permease/ATP-binding protein CydD [Vibrio sp. S17_S38]MBD1573834.1 cysteine/glutathione ABC transporter permease/ATP-binding protein CydD [Vibrio sp. S17_S38]